jgi:hypothetical protein
MSIVESVPASGTSDMHRITDNLARHSFRFAPRPDLDDHELFTRVHTRRRKAAMVCTVTCLLVITTLVLGAIAVFFNRPIDEHAVAVYLLILASVVTCFAVQFAMVHRQLRMQSPATSVTVQLLRLRAM